MRARLSYTAAALALVFYCVLTGDRAMLLIADGRPVTVALGVAVLVLPAIGGWFLWHTTRFARHAGRLGRQLEAEGGLPVDELVRTPSGRIDRDCADAVFVARRAETEAAPDDWRTWFRLAVAYFDARDTPRARRAMQHAIALHGAAPHGASVRDTEVRGAGQGGGHG